MKIVHSVPTVIINKSLYQKLLKDKKRLNYLEENGFPRLLSEFWMVGNKFDNNLRRAIDRYIKRVG